MMTVYGTEDFAVIRNLIWTRLKHSNKYTKRMFS